ncbi:MAG: heme exporter protein CcmB [Alphaproteobacteria bacterium]
MSQAQPLMALVTRDLRLAFRTGGAGLSLAFFLLVVVLLPFAAGTDPALMKRIGPGVIWIAALLAVLLTLERLFQADLEAGVLDLLAAAPVSFELLVLAKTLAHWLAIGVPLTLLAIVAGLLLGLSLDAALALASTLLIGTPGLSCTGAIAGALTAGVRRGSLLLTLLVLPLYAPFVIFGAGAATLAANPAPPETPFPALLLLGACSLMAAFTALILMPSAVKSQLD